MTLINLILHCVQNYVFCNFLQMFVVEVVVVVKGWAILVFGYIKGENNAYFAPFMDKIYGEEIRKYNYSHISNYTDFLYRRSRLQIFTAKILICNGERRQILKFFCFVGFFFF